MPLHLIDPSKDVIDEVGSFARTEGLPHNPLDPDSPEPNLLIIFDGLDELAGQGKAAAETARAFVREVDRAVEKRQRPKLRVLISGRELVVQENESSFGGASRFSTCCRISRRRVRTIKIRANYWRVICETIGGRGMVF